MKAVDPHYSVVIDRAYTLAAQRSQRMDSPHLVWAIIHGGHWPGILPSAVEPFVQAVIATLGEDARREHDTTLYAQMVLDRSHDLASLWFHLFWSPWNLDQPFIQTCHHLGWAPPLRTQENEIAYFPPVQPTRAPDDVANYRRQQREMVRQQRSERPQHVIEILRHVENERFEFWCTHALQYPSYSVIFGIQWNVDQNIERVQHIVRLEIEANGIQQAWPRVRYEQETRESSSLRIESQFIAAENYVVSASDTLVAITNDGERLRLLGG